MSDVWPPDPVAAVCAERKYMSAKADVCISPAGRVPQSTPSLVSHVDHTARLEETKEMTQRRRELAAMLRFLGTCAAQDPRDSTQPTLVSEIYNCHEARRIPGVLCTGSLRSSLSLVTEMLMGVKRNSGCAPKMNYDAENSIPRSPKHNATPCLQASPTVLAFILKQAEPYPRSFSNKQ